ncbi:MAG: hypothetical protein WC179_04415 [Candidatus Cloacimonadaceae bacterium]|nr:hypothetical protein [Candidatus Cloacimonadota bacterium]MDY0112523.1 hypothetical protein [Candidatus Syntrophosphaera sp.]
MKMNILFGHLFWGILVILIGVSLILKGFNISFPIFKIFIAIIIILLGVKLLIGGWGSTKKKDINVRTYTSTENEYNAIFAAQKLDLTNIEPDASPLEINAVFGSLQVELPDDIIFDYNTTACCGSIDLPENAPKDKTKARGTVKIEANAVFGKITFIVIPHQSLSEQDL